ncbi:hypothetical protein GOBAR_DD14109 [Gossypium barbadense]|nr:hypothetical protein GOBAR_DD14109 [Gossypium barbadense]
MERSKYDGRVVLDQREKIKAYGLEFGGGIGGGGEVEGIWGNLGLGLGGREVGVIVLEEKVGKWRFLGRESRGKSWWWGESKGGKGLFLGRTGSVSCMACEREISDIRYKCTLQITKGTRISICLNPGKERELHKE